MNALPLSDLLASLPELFLAASALLLLVLGVFRGNDYVASLTALVIAVLLGAMLLVVDSHHSMGTAYQGMFISNVFTITMKLLVLAGAAMVLFLALPRLRQQRVFEFPILVLLATLGLMLMISANDLLALYVGLELASLSLYVLAAMDRGNERSAEAGLKYFVLGALASGMLLYGISLVYGFTGTTNFTDLAKVLAIPAGGTLSIGALVGLVFVLVGLCFKVSAAPFHMWTPDVYEGAPTEVTAFFAIAPKIAGLALFTRVLMEPFGALAGQWQQIIIFVAVASMLVGAFAALRQTNIKRLLAYSSIGHVGYALMGLATHSLGGVQGVVIYLALYLFMSAGAFAVVLLMQRKGKPVEAIDDLKGLARLHPRTAAAMAIFMFSMAGIPPLAGFFGKMMVFLAVVQAGLMWLAVIGVLASVVSAYYYLRIVKIMYLDAVENPLDADHALESRIVLAVTAVVTLLFFVYPTPLFEAAKEAAKSLGLS
jgi:NADH-quinone oxidoreductase subunit N